MLKEVPAWIVLNTSRLYIELPTGLLYVKPFSSVKTIDLKQNNKRKHQYLYNNTPALIVCPRWDKSALDLQDFSSSIYLMSYSSLTYDTFVRLVRYHRLTLFNLAFLYY